VKKFTFSLNILLDVLRRKERESQNEFFKSQVSLEKLALLLKKIQKQSKEVEENIFDNLISRIDPQDLSLQYNYLLDLKKKKNIHQDTLKLGQVKVEKLRLELIARMQKRKALENLIKKKLLKWNRKLISEEREFFDEISTQNFIHLKPRNKV
jgi:flagellar export protein FliJ